VLRRIQTLYQLGPVGGLTDGELLARFATERGAAAELAFATLVERHGPMVLRVCRSVLCDEHDAQDAFQATFLILVRRAGAVRKRDSVGSWLYGVALRAAACARAAAARRRAHERRVAELSTTTSSAEGEPDLIPVLHEELGRLPERYRAALVLCYLEGLSCEEAARRLGWPVGTVKSRLARGRERLRDRLARRGLAPSIGLGVMLAAEGSQASVPVVLTDATVQAAVQLTTIKAAATGVVSASVAALAGKVVKAMLLNKLRMAAVIALSFSVIAIGMAVLVYQHRAVGAPPQNPQVTVPVRQEQAPDPSKAMAQEQLKLARQALRDLDLMSKGEAVSRRDPRFALWERRQVEAILATGASRAELLAALENYVKQMKEQQRFAQLALEKDQGSRVDVWDAQYRVLEAEMWLNQEKAR
jgi:RNA polymerase sigma factor (sigma-70 family)